MAIDEDAIVARIAEIVSGAPAPSARSKNKARQIYGEVASHFPVIEIEGEVLAGHSYVIRVEKYEQLEAIKDHLGALKERTGATFVVVNGSTTIEEHQ